MFVRVLYLMSFVWTMIDFIHDSHGSTYHLFSNIVTEQRNWPRSVFCWLKSCWWLSLKYLTELRIFATMFTDHSVSGDELTRDVWWAWSVSRAGPWCGDTAHSDPGIMKQSCVHILVKPPESVIIRVTRVRQSKYFLRIIWIIQLQQYLMEIREEGARWKKSRGKLNFTPEANVGTTQIRHNLFNIYIKIEKFSKKKFGSV